MTAKIIYERGDILNKDSRLFYVCDTKEAKIPRAAIFECECGSRITARTSNVKNGNTNSCGCYSYTLIGALNRIHGMTGTPEYSTWKNMVNRCTNIKDRRYKDYGGRGITICAGWLRSFEVFYADMGDKPDTMTIDRKDNDKGYSKENCRWATRSQQARNTRNSTYITLNGKTQTIGDWADAIGIKYHTLYQRLNKLGWTVERALSSAAESR